MIRTFRPWQLFERLTPEQDSLALKIPRVPGTTSRTIFMLETAILVAAARLVNAKSILEIGTSMGHTALHLAMNTSADIATVDIIRKPCVFEDTEWEPRIQRGIGNYRELNIGNVDMVFIDASHEYSDVCLDTSYAFSLKPSCVAWHDYSNPMEPGVMRALSNLAETESIIHVQDTWLALWFKEDLR